MDQRLWLVGIMLVGCRTKPDDTETQTAEGCEDRARTCAEIEAAFAAVTADVSLACSDGDATFVLTAAGAPEYDSNQSTPNDIIDQNWTIELPLAIVCADSPESVLDSRGEIAFTVSGLPIYGPQDALGRDAVEFEGPTMDDCWGHADDRCQYHHHSEPVCALGEGEDLEDHAEADGHMPVVGFALDGIAIHATDPDDTTGESLDDCNGHFGETRGYHYHTSSDSPYTIACYAGVASGSASSAPTEECESAGAPPPPPSN